MKLSTVSLSHVSCKYFCLQMYCKMVTAVQRYYWHQQRSIPVRSVVTHTKVETTNCFYLVRFRWDRLHWMKSIYESWLLTSFVRVLIWETVALMTRWRANMSCHRSYYVRKRPLTDAHRSFDENETFYECSSLTWWERDLLRMLIAHMMKITAPRTYCDKKTCQCQRQHVQSIRVNKWDVLICQQTTMSVSQMSVYKT